MDNDKFVEELAERVYEDYFTVAPKYRTSERMQELVTRAIREAMAQAYRDAAHEAMGWTGEINTVENAHAVTETCKGIAKQLEQKAEGTTK